MICKICNQEVGSQYFLTKHRKTQHPETYKTRQRKTSEIGNFADKIHQGENLIREALREVDAERNIISAKLLELDNLAAKYRKILNPNGI